MAVNKRGTCRCNSGQSISKRLNRVSSWLRKSLPRVEAYVLVPLVAVSSELQNYKQSVIFVNIIVSVSIFLFCYFRDSFVGILFSCVFCFSLQGSLLFCFLYFLHRFQSQSTAALVVSSVWKSYWHNIACFVN